MTCPRDCTCLECAEAWRAWVARRNARRFAKAYDALLCAADDFARARDAGEYDGAGLLLDAARAFVAADRGES